jgi:hypothetical protein
MIFNKIGMFLFIFATGTLVTSHLSRAMEDSAPSHASRLAPAHHQQLENFTGLAALTDNIGTVCQHLLVPVAITSQACRHEKLSTFISSFVINELFIALGKRALGLPQSSRIPLLTEPLNPEQETVGHYAGRKAANGAIHGTNQCIKILTSVAPWTLLGIVLHH